MSFSSLPPELVHQIIESTVPHAFHSTTYKERQRTLCSLSLVSKLFRSIAQPLLFEIVKLENFGHIDKLPRTRATEGEGHSCGSVRWLVVIGNGWLNRAPAGEEEDQILERLRDFASVTSFTVWGIAQENFENFLSIMAHQLTSLHVSICDWKEPVRTHLPNLRNLILCGVSSELFDALVNPATVPNLRNFAFVNGGGNYMEDLTRSKLEQLLPQLETLNFAARIWLDSQATFLRSAASRTLVNFNSDDAERLASMADLQHVRISHSSPHSFLFSPDNLHDHLDRWATYIQNNSSLSLKSIYLDSSLQLLSTLPAATQTRLETLTRVCQERKIDLVFETVPLDYTLDPNISSEFMRRQKDQRKKESRKSGERTKLNE